MEERDETEEIGEETSEWVIEPPPEDDDREEPAPAKPEARKPKADPEVAELRARVVELEAALASAEARAESAERRPVDQPVRPVEPRVPRTRSTGGGPADINTAGYEELRELGLSVAESAQLIAVRDVRGGIRSLDELDDVGDFPAERLTELKSRLRV